MFRIISLVHHQAFYTRKTARKCKSMST